MEISPRTLREVEFREKLRGYHPDDVDEFLERVAAAMEALQDKLRDATERANLAAQHAAADPAFAPEPAPAPAAPVEGDDNLKRTLALAQRTSDLAIQEARDHAAHILQEAQKEGQRIVDAASQHADAVIRAGQEQLRNDVARLEAARERARADHETLVAFLEQERARLQQALAEALGRLDQIVPAAVSAPTPPPLDLPAPGLAQPAP
jgi:cell division initiation protein